MSSSVLRLSKARNGTPALVRASGTGARTGKPVDGPTSIEFLRGTSSAKLAGSRNQQQVGGVPTARRGVAVEVQSPQREKQKETAEHWLVVKGGARERETGTQLGWLVMKEEARATGTEL